MDKEKTNETIEKLKQLSPVPVVFLSKPERKKSNKINASRRDKSYGSYHPAHIEILNDIKDDAKIVVLAHEIGHALCYEKNCGCTKSTDFRAPIRKEAHANVFELIWLLENKQKTPLKMAMATLKRYDRKKDLCHWFAAHLEMKTELWQKCLDYIECSEIELMRDKNLLLGTSIKEIYFPYAEKFMGRSPRLAMRVFLLIIRVRKILDMFITTYPPICPNLLDPQIRKEI